MAGNVASSSQAVELGSRFAARVGSRRAVAAAALPALALLLLSLASAAEGADWPGAEASGTSGEPSLEEVVVTARRRNESLSRVPAAITAFNAEQLLERSIRTGRREVPRVHSRTSRHAERRCIQPMDPGCAAGGVST